MIKRKTVLIVLAGSVLLASCNGDDQATVNGTAINQITKLTCNANTPSDINNVNFTDDESQVNVNTLTPGCNLPGG